MHLYGLSPNLLCVLVSVELGDGTFQLDQDAVTTLDGSLPVVVYKGIQILKGSVFYQEVAGAPLDGFRADSAVIDPLVCPVVRGELEGLEVRGHGAVHPSYGGILSMCIATWCASY